MEKITHISAEQATQESLKSLYKAQEDRLIEEKRRLEYLGYDLRNLFNTNIKSQIDHGRGSVSISRPSDLMAAERATSRFKFDMSPIILFYATVAFFLVTLGITLSFVDPYVIPIFKNIGLIYILTLVISFGLSIRWKRPQPVYESKLLRIEKQILEEFRASGYKVKFGTNLTSLLEITSNNYIIKWF